MDQSGVVGFAAVQTIAELHAVRPEELTMLYVLARAHGGGAGQALLNATLGGRPASLWVAANNPRARAFYRRNVFTPDGARPASTPSNNRATRLLIERSWRTAGSPRRA
ncbi:MULTISPECIES: N-acetyltransferase [unclassified Curtobacterium]|uniref:GNAT family N-acetyltransferase n=1 Tax=unclassified Curtobacterium TaxID=257496 RepID=UPI0021AC6723|nr:MULTISPECIES: GNAT family N-acetyltransferase [unclassified Curtobacterium]